MTKLDEITVNLELVLVSLIQGVALVFLGQYIVQTLAEPDWYRYIAHGFVGLVILLVFWAISTTRILSFIQWPLRLERLLLYFIAGLAQILAYANITSLDGWFFWWMIFSFVVLCLYIVDLWMLRESYPKFEHMPGSKEFLEKFEERHLFEMKYLIPIALGINAIMWITALIVPRFFQPWWIYEIPAAIQFFFFAYVLFDVVKNFHIRTEMLSKVTTTHSGHTI